MPRVRTRPTSEPPIPPQPLPEPVLPPGQRVIPLHRRISGSNRHPHTLRFAVITHTTLDEVDYIRFSPYRWLAFWDEHCRSYVPFRKEKIDGEAVTIYLAREILDLSRNPGRTCDQQVDHIDHNPLNNARDNLRVATPAQNSANQRHRRNSVRRFRGVKLNYKGYLAQFTHNGKHYHLPTVPLEAEAAFMFNHAISLLRDPLAQRNNIPPNELPSPSRQAELITLVENKLRKLGLIA